MKTIKTRIGDVLAYWSMYCSECGTTYKVVYSDKYNATLCQNTICK